MVMMVMVMMIVVLNDEDNCDIFTVHAATPDVLCILCVGDIDSLLFIMTLLDSSVIAVLY